MLNKIIKFLLISLILSLGFGQLLRFEFFSVPIYLHDILNICLLALLLPKGLTYDWRSVVVVKRTFLDRRPEQSSSRDTEGGRRVLMGTIGISLFLLSLLLSSLFALTHYPLSSLIIPSLYMFRLLAYVVLYFLIKQSKLKIPTNIFILSGLVSLAIGYLQYFFLPDMRVFQYLGWDDHLSRLTLPHFDPTFTAVMFCLAVLSHNNFSSIFNILVLLFYSISILLTYSRSVWLSLACTALIFIKNKFILLLAVSCMLLVIFLLPQKFGEGTNLLRTYSISSRFQSDLSYIQKYKWDLLLGRGMNTLILDASPSKYPDHASGPNNSYLYLLTASGVLGLVGWGIFMFSLYRQSAYKPMLIFFFIASLFNNVMFYPFALLWVLLIEAMAPTSV